ncbi:MAG TPA: hypothetical protein VL633_04985, partial [Bacteroidota bacterium]|nr:hypothetical protein [Bacteroidota bacterium]
SILIASALHGQSRVELPDSALKILTSKYSGWHWVDNINVITLPVLRELHLDTTKCRPNFAWGDFDGNGKRDYVAFIERHSGEQREQFLVALISKGLGFQDILLDQETGGAHIADYIWLVKKGSNSYDFERNKKFVLKRDAVELIYIEKGSELIYFDGGQFNRLTTSD